MSNNSFKHFDHSSMKDENVRLNDEQFNVLKEIYVDRLVDNMSSKDLVRYVFDDMTKWVDSLTYNEAMIEFKEYWDEYFTDTIDEVLEIHPND
mgnify:FL=1